MKKKLSVEEIRSQPLPIIYDFVLNDANKRDLINVKTFYQVTVLYRSTIPKPTVIAAEQKITKPPFREIAENLLQGEVKDNLFELVQFCKELKISP